MSKFDAISHRLVLERWIRKKGFTRIAEVGVKKGNTFLYLLENCPNLTVVGIDIWENEVEKLPEHEQRLRQIVAEKYKDRGVLIKAPSVVASQMFDNSSFDLVFIDADHSEQSVREDITAWRRKVRPGGILCGHDAHMEGVRRAVDSLCPGWLHNDQHVWSINCKDPQILTMIPYADDRNYGRACNEFMECIPDDAWACVVDHDAMFTTPEWHRQLTSAAIQRPDGCFSAMTNRIKCEWQLVPDVDVKNHDIQYHRQIGEKLLESHKMLDVTDDPNDKTPGGLIMMMSKQAWKEAGGFPQGLHYLDRIMWLALKKAKRRIFIIKGLYLYHWHRGAGEPIQKGEWVRPHKMPNGEVIGIADRSKLPVYGQHSR